MARAVVFSGWSWDDIGGEWGFSSAEVAMMLTPPYLSKGVDWDGGGDAHCQLW